MTVVYLSRPMAPGMPAYNGDRDAFTVTPIGDLDQGDGANSLRLSLSNHLGAHIDFPRHVFRDGRTLSDYSADYFFFRRPLVLHLPLANGRYLTAEDLDGLAADPEADLVLLKTDYGRFYGQDKYWNDNPGLSPEAAARLKNECPNLRAVGVDFLSMNAYCDKAPGRAAHRFLLSPPELLIIEDLDLAPLDRGAPLWISAAPLRVAGADGAPVTVLAALEDVRRLPADYGGRV